jgi:hypothetical protein
MTGSSSNSHTHSVIDSTPQNGFITAAAATLFLSEKMAAAAATRKYSKLWKRVFF